MVRLPRLFVELTTSPRRWIVLVRRLTVSEAGLRKVSLLHSLPRSMRNSDCLFRRLLCEGWIRPGRSRCRFCDPARRSRISESTPFTAIYCHPRGLPLDLTRDLLLVFAAVVGSPKGSISSGRSARVSTSSYCGPAEIGLGFRPPSSTMRSLSRRRMLSAMAAAVTLVALSVLGFYIGPGFYLPRFSRHISLESFSVGVPHRKLLQEGPAAAETDRVGEECSKDDIVIYQGATSPLPNGIPTYTVEVLNVCVRGCAIARIHLSCGWFSSARLINPRLFRRLRYNDCLVNDGRPLSNGSSLSFQYANSFKFPLSVSSATCLSSSP